MKLKYIIYTIFIGSVFGQTLLNNAQLDEIRDQLKSDSAISVLDSEGVEDVDDSSLPSEVILVSPDGEGISSEYFGYNYFNRDINFFDNIPTPSDFKLGPGDEIIISMWGETNLRENFTINKDGLIYYKNIGFINLSNKNLKEAEEILVEKLSKIYSTLKDEYNQTSLTLELGTLKSINVYFSGQIENSGINLIHPFSDIFSAIVQSGGIKQEGSLRSIQLIRNGNIISTFDFYNFFTDGKNNFSNIRILDGDVIHVPIVSKRVEIIGAVTNNGYYEIKDNENLKHLVNYAGGFNANAASTFILDSIIPISERKTDDNARVSKFIHIDDINIKFNNGDKISVPQIGDVATRVEIFGRVKYPGLYPGTNLSLQQVLLAAGGFEDPLYRKSIRDDEILILRKDENQFYGLEFKVAFKESEGFDLKPGDKIFVYENVNYQNLFSIEVKGQVNKKGRYQLKKGMSVDDAINLAEGFTELANQKAIIITEVFTSTNDLGDTIEETRQVNNANLDFELTDGSVVNVLPLENVVSVQGNVYNPGLVTFAKAKTVNKYINLAGGPKPNTLSTKIYVKRANGRIKRATFFQGIGTIVQPGDTIFVPEDPNPSEFNVTSFTADILSVLTNIAAILVIVDNND